MGLGGVHEPWPNCDTGVGAGTGTGRVVWKLTVRGSAMFRTSTNSTGPGSGTCTGTSASSSYDLLK